MKGAIGNMMKQAQQMQADLQKAQEAVAAMEVTGESGAGMVSVVMTGRHDVKRVHIDPQLLQDDLAMLEDLIASAVNDANRRVERLSQEKMAAVTSGIKLPPGFKLPF